MDKNILERISNDYLKLKSKFPKVIFENGCLNYEIENINLDETKNQLTIYIKNGKNIVFTKGDFDKKTATVICTYKKDNTYGCMEFYQHSIFSRTKI